MYEGRILKSSHSMSNQPAIAGRIAEWNNRISKSAMSSPETKSDPAQDSQQRLASTVKPSRNVMAQKNFRSASLSAKPTARPERTASPTPSASGISPPSSYSHMPDKSLRPNIPTPLPRSVTKGTTSSDKVLGSTRRKKAQETLFFGDGLYDLSAEHSEEVSQFKESLSRLRQQYSCSDADTNAGVVFSPEVTWMPHNQSTLSLLVVVPTQPRPITMTVQASNTVSEVISLILDEEKRLGDTARRLSTRSLFSISSSSGVSQEPMASPQRTPTPESSSSRDHRKTISEGGAAEPRRLSPDRLSLQCPSGSVLGSNSSASCSQVLSPVKARIATLNETSGVSSSPLPSPLQQDSLPRRDSSAQSAAGVFAGSLSAERSRSRTNPERFHLKVAGRSEVLKHSLPVGHYQYVHHCCRFSKPVHVELLLKELLTANYARKAEDDTSDVRKDRLDAFMPTAETTSISKRGVDVLLDQFSKECKCLLAADAADRGMHVDRVLQMSKAIVLSLASVESAAMTDSLGNLKLASATTGSAGDNLIKSSLAALRKVMAKEMQMYCDAFELGMATASPPGRLIDISITSPSVRVSDLAQDINLSINIISAHRLRSKEHVGLMVSVEYAGQLLSKVIKTDVKAPSEKVFLESVVWNNWIDLMPLRLLPREAQIRFTLFTPLDKDHDYEKELQSLPEHATSPLVEGVYALSCVSVPVFNFRGYITNGKQMVGLWPYHQYPPYGFVSSNIISKDSPIIQFEIASVASDVKFPEPDIFETMDVSGSDASVKPFKDSVEHAIRVITRKGSAEKLSDAEKKWLWEQRYHCWRQVSTTSPHSLGLFLSAVPAWDSRNAALAQALARSWPTLDPIDALGVLDGRVVDFVVRGIAVQKLHQCPDYLLCDILPQLLQAVKFDQGHLSALVVMLFQRAMSSVAVAHRLFWNCHILLGDRFFSKRFALLTAGLKMLVGNALRDELSREMHLMKKLNAVATEFKGIPPAARSGVLTGLLENGMSDVEWPLRLPLDPGMEVSGLNYEKCTYFSSNAAPLKLTFTNSNPSMPDISCIYKVGDDIRQDQIVLQMLRVMDNLWQEAGLDLRIITYQCLSFSEDSGILEIVDKASTLREIQTIDGVTGSFKDAALLTWLSHHNSSHRELNLAVENFTLSCAGFCVATYVLGVCDRHNDNIMLRRSGHLFHIDFGRFLGNAQKFGSFKRDRTPFTLTSDMAYVINMGEQISPNFQEFVDTCCQAFNILRHHAAHLANILTLMRTSGMQELSQPEDVQYVVDTLMPDLTDLEATTAFTRMIEESLKNWFTKLNFFIHNLGQLGSSTAAVESPILSFCPRNFTIAQTGSVVSASITHFVRKECQDTHYLYAIDVCWDMPAGSEKKASGPSVIYRRFREFYELQSKLQEMVGPTYELPQLPSKLILRRSNTVEVASKRMEQLNVYLQKLVTIAPQISQSDLVVTFFTHFVRDDTDSQLTAMTSSNGGPAITGSIKLSLTYMSHAQKLVVVVGHAKKLSRTLSGTSPDSYVKLYLIPDPSKTSKKKTRVIKNTQHPTFNESFTFDLSPFSKVSLQERQLQVTVWHHETLSKPFLGCVHIDMRKIMRQKTEETVTEWYNLQPMYS